MGFDLFLLESGLYDCARIWHTARQGASLHATLQNSVFFMYSESQEMKPLFDYIDNRKEGPRPLEFACMDSQLSGALSKDRLVSDLEEFFVSGGSKLVLGETWNWVKALTNAMIENLGLTVPPDQLARYQGFLDSLIEEAPALSPRSSQEVLDQAGFWQNILRGLRIQMDKARDTAGVWRDAQMAANARWLLENPRPDRKAVLWVHNVHAFKSFKGAREIGRDLDWSRVRPMGQHLSEAYGEKVYVVGFTGREGAFVSYQDRKRAEIQAQDDGRLENSLDSALAIGFLDFHRLPRSAKWLEEEQTLALWDYRAFRAVPAQLMDGMVYIRTSIPTVSLGP